LSRHRTAAAHAILCWKQTAGLDFPAKKKKRKENPCSQRARSALVNNPPTDQQFVRPTHVLISVSGGKKKLKNKNKFCPVIHAENVGHTRLAQLTVLIRERGGQQEIPVAFISFVCCVAVGKTRK
jgi:hypothetical protein